jgi:hypothetical protein
MHTITTFFDRMSNTPTSQSIMPFSTETSHKFTTYVYISADKIDFLKLRSTNFESESEQNGYRVLQISPFYLSDLYHSQ